MSPTGAHCIHISPFDLAALDPWSSAHCPRLCSLPHSLWPTQSLHFKARWHTKKHVSLYTTVTLNTHTNTYKISPSTNNHNKNQNQIKSRERRKELGCRCYSLLSSLVLSVDRHTQLIHWARLFALCFVYLELRVCLIISILDLQAHFSSLTGWDARLLLSLIYFCIG